MNVVGAWFENALVFAIVFPALLVAEAVIPPAGGRRRLRGRSSDVAWLAAVLIAVPVAALVSVRASGVVAPHGPFAAFFADVPIAALVVAFVGADFVAYALHRAEHRVAALWRYHAVHHASTPVDALAGYRFHPVNIVLERCLPVLAIAMLGVPAAAFVPYLAAAFVVTAIAHVNIAVPATPVDRMIVTPAYHRHHHEHERQHYAFVLPLFDQLFGSTAQRTINNPIANDTALAANAMPTSSAKARR